MTPPKQSLHALDDVESLLSERLTVLKPQLLELIDDSAQHVGHVGAQSGGHYRLRLVSAAFVGQSILLRHRMVHAALGDLMRSRIHALSIQAFSPDEVG